MNPNPKKKHRPKHGPKHCFGTEAWTVAQTMFRSIPKQCFGINYSMPLNRGHRIAKMRGHRGLANPNPNPKVNPNLKLNEAQTEARTEALLWYRSMDRSTDHVSVHTEAVLRY